MAIRGLDNQPRPSVLHGRDPNRAFIIGINCSQPALRSLASPARKLPGNMVLGGSNSKVISAACHSVPLPPAIAATKLTAVNVQSMEEPRGDALGEMATRKLKWGQISCGGAGDEVGHLAFGVEEQEITEPVDGKFYSGYGR
ncbi:hypothetical protein ACJZ2D_011490 [Fusarium nematophilum]